MLVCEEGRKVERDTPECFLSDLLEVIPHLPWISHLSPRDLTHSENPVLPVGALCGPPRLLFGPSRLGRIS